jgi:hypothetical protein
MLDRGIMFLFTLTLFSHFAFSLSLSLSFLSFLSLSPSLSLASSSSSTTANRDRDDAKRSMVDPMSAGSVTMRQRRMSRIGLRETARQELQYQR